MSYGGGGYRNPRSNVRFDAKELSRQRRNELISLDPDIRGRDDLEDDDLDVPQTQTRPTRNNQVQRRGDAQLARGAASARNPLVTVVSVRNCASSGLRYILKIIGNYIENFRPIAPQVKDMDIEFFIVDDKQADAIRLMNRRIPDRRNNNARLVINIRRTSAPWSILDRRMRDTIDSVLKKRFNKATNALDLSDFGSDNVFLTNKMICNLSRNDVMVYVCNVVEREYSDVVGLSLKENRLRSLVYPSSLSWRAKEVKILDLSNNDFTKIDDLERISAWNIEKLHLENNPLCAPYTDADQYTRDVQVHFPSLTYLDGYNVQPLAPPPPETRSNLLPTPKLGYCDNDDVRKIVERFLAEYITLFDDENSEITRKQLMAAYMEDAEFSYCINTLESGGYARGDGEIYGQWLRGSRNIVFEEKWIGNPDRVKYKGAMDVAVALAKLPGTCHLVDTFILDISFILKSICGFTLRGLFRDGKDRANDRSHVKMFMRHFLVKSTGEGQLAIICDSLHVCPITREAERSYRALMNQARREASQADMPGPSGVHQPQYTELTGFNNSAAAVPSIVVTAPPPTPTPVVDANIKRQMVEQFSLQTGMKVPYAERCLEDNNYDYEAAGRRFLEIRSSIPPEAFS
uniref:Nuclear RNA export factor 1 n=1 Tax=Panagrellus redivivus TaxID=6233 RepID=A0A7E4VN04_PANRE